MIHLRSISLNREKALPTTYPFNVAAIQSLESLEFDSPLTFFVGENGSGKSTVLEAIAVAAELPSIGSQEAGVDETLNQYQELSKYLKWVWNKRIRKGFFMRSEDFFGYAKRIAQEMAYNRAELERDDAHHAGQSDYAKALQKSTFAGQLAALKNFYGDGLDAQSHGESYMKLFRSRFRPAGIYLMDEPEAPLSPNRQLMLIAMLKEMMAQDAQFIIATHSPILLAYPGATIYNFAHGSIEKAAYDDLEHVQITRSFLNNPDSYLRHLLE
jgi:predicted ATPase